MNFVIANGTLRVAGSSVFLFLVSICDLRHFRRFENDQFMCMTPTAFCQYGFMSNFL